MRNLKTAFSLLSLIAILSSCSPHNFSSDSSSSPPNLTEANPDPISDQPTSYIPLTWEAGKKDRALWSAIIYSIIKLNEPGLVQYPVSDIQTFCPRYATLNATQRANFWGQLIVAMSSYESSWNPLARFVETSMGNDPVTGVKIASEGLLQLSYQDELSHPEACDFNWSADQSLLPIDPRKTILNPAKNLRCGLGILAKQVKNKGAIGIGKGAYWAVLKTDNPKNKIAQISAITKNLSFCQ